MFSADRSLVITFNGEMYNHKELRAGLAQRGCQFLTRSDTEVILHLYEQEGEECVHKLNGQWAFAICDTRKKQIFASRDRMAFARCFTRRWAIRFSSRQR